MEPEPALHDFLDRSLRDLLGKPPNLRDFLAEAVPDLASHLEVERMRPVPREFLTPNWRRRIPDLLLEVPCRVAGPESTALICLLLEHQSKAEWQVPLRICLYSSAVWERQFQEWERAPSPKPDFALMPILPIVLHTGPRPWGSAKSLRELLGPPTSFHGLVPDWQPIYWDLAGHSVDELLARPEPFLQALAILKADNASTDRAETLFAEVFGRLDSLHSVDPARWRDLIGFEMGRAFHRRPIAERKRWHEMATGLIADSNRRQEFEVMGQTIAQAVYQEGREEVLARTRVIFLRAAQRLLGQPDPATEATMRGLNIDQIERLSNRLDTASNWVELLQAEREFDAAAGH